MNRVSAPSSGESGTTQSCRKQIDDDIIDLIERDVNLDFLRDDNLDDVLSLVTGDSAVNRKENVAETPDIVSTWVESGEETFDLHSTGTPESSYLVDGAVFPVRSEINDGGQTKRMFVKGRKPLRGAVQMQSHDPETISLPYLDTRPRVFFMSSLVGHSVRSLKISGTASKLARLWKGRFHF